MEKDAGKCEIFGKWKDFNEGQERRLLSFIIV